MIGLPDGWALATLQDVAAWSSGGTPSRSRPAYYAGTIPWLKTGELGPRVLNSSEEHISEEAVSSSSAKVFPKGSVALAMYGATIGKTSIFGIDAATNQACAVGIPDATSAEFLYYFLVSQEKAFVDAGKGGAQPNISQGIVKAWPLLLPPAMEQTRIVEKLEELLSDLDAGVAELKAAQKKLGQYRQSLLKAAVEGAALGEPYPRLPLDSLVTSIGQGWSPKCDRQPAEVDDRWAVMKTTAIQPLGFDGSHNKALPDDLKPRVNLELKTGDLLITRAGPRNRVGITCLVRITRPRLILCDKVYRIRCDEMCIDPSFLELVLNAPHMVQRIDEMKTGISDSGLNLTQDRFFTLEIPLPTIEEQRSIVEVINAQLTAIQNQEQSIELSLKQAAAQRKNILKAAFSGQLVPQDPNDEPASVLLQRIRAERAERNEVKMPRRRKTKEGA